MSWTRERARLAAHHRHHPDADDTALRRDLAAARLEHHIATLVEQAPPLTETQRAKLATLLRPVGAA
jgi:hypothetical protein